MRRFRAILVLPVAFLIVGCAGKGDLREMEETLIAEFRELEAEQDSLHRELEALRRELAAGLESREGEAMADRGAVLNRLSELERQVGRVAALAGQNQQLLTRLEERSRAERVRGRTPAGAAEGDTSAASREDAAADDTATDGAAGGDGDPRGLYQAALQQFRRGSFGTARDGLEAFLSQNPEHELAPDAQFYVAESHAEEGEQRRALEAYGRVVELFPDSRRAASALYKSGLIELERGNVGDARVFFRRVESGYPDSDEAALAHDQLDRLEGGG